MPSAEGVCVLVIGAWPGQVRAKPHAFRGTLVVQTGSDERNKSASGRDPQAFRVTGGYSRVAT